MQSDIGAVSGIKAAAFNYPGIDGSAFDNSTATSVASGIKLTARIIRDGVVITVSTGVEM